MLHRLPVELLRIIFAFVGRPTLNSFLLTSKRIHDEAELKFCETVFLSFSSADVTSTISRLHGLHNRITACNSRLAWFVKELVVSLNSISFPSEAQACLDNILRELSNLEIFTFSDEGYQDHHIILPVLHSIDAPFSLKRLDWSNTVFNVDTFAAFLGTQKSLEHLRVPDLRSPISMPPAALPRLHILESSLENAGSILPGRHVTHFKATGLIRLLNTHLTTEALRDIRVFCGYGLYEPFVILASMMPNLEYLSIYASQPLDRMLDFIKDLKSTRIRYLRVTGWGSHAYYAIASDVMRRSFDCLPTLLYVEMQKTAGGSHERWCRHDPTQPVQVKWPRRWSWLRPWELVD